MSRENQEVKKVKLPSDISPLHRSGQMEPFQGRKPPSYDRQMPFAMLRMAKEKIAPCNRETSVSRLASAPGFA